MPGPAHARCRPSRIPLCRVLPGRTAIAKPFQAVLVFEARFGGTGLVVVALRRLTIVVTKEAFEAHHVRRLLDRIRGGDGIAKQVRIYGAAELFLCPIRD